MKKLFAFLSLFVFLAPLAAQPPEPGPDWTITDSNPISIEPPAGWTGSLECADFSPDGALLAVGGNTSQSNGQNSRGALLLFDGRTGAPKGELRGHEDFLQNLAFSPDGKFLASQSQDGAMFLWDVENRKLLHRLSEGHGKLDWKKAMLEPRLIFGAWSPDGKSIAAFEMKFDVSIKPAGLSWRLKTFDAQSGKLTRTFATRPGVVSGMAWSQNGKNLLVASQIIEKGKQLESAIETINAQNGEVLHSALKNTDERRYIIAFDANSKRVMTNALEMSPDGKSIVSETAQLWDLKTEQALWTQNLPRGGVRRVAFSRDGKTIYAGNGDSEIVVRDGATGEVQKTLPVGGCNDESALELSPDGTRLVKLEQASSSIQLWKLDEPIPAPRFPSRIILRNISNPRAFDWSGESVRVVTGVEDWSHETDLPTGKEIRLDTWNAATEKTERQSIPETKIVGAGALSPDGALLAIELGTQPKPAFFATEGVGIYDLRAGKMRFLLPEQYGVDSIAWSPDGKTVATGTGGAAVKLWNSATGELRGELPANGGESAWSADGKLFAVGSREGEIQIFDTATATEQSHWSTPGAIRRLAFSPDGHTLAAGVVAQNGGEFSDYSVRLFEVTTGKPMREFPTQGYLRDMHWTPDGSGIAASIWRDPNRAANSKLQVWDAATGAERITIEDRCSISSFAFSPDGKKIAAENWMRVRVWDLK
jgi:WD40 repeat protein